MPIFNLYLFAIHLLQVTLETLRFAYQFAKKQMFFFTLSILTYKSFSDPAMRQRSWRQSAPRASRFPTVAAKKITATDFSRNSSKLICIIACGTSAPQTPYTALGKVKMTPRHAMDFTYILRHYAEPPLTNNVTTIVKFQDLLNWSWVFCIFI